VKYSDCRGSMFSSPSKAGDAKGRSPLPIKEGAQDAC